MALLTHYSGVVEAGCDEAGRGPLAGPVFAAAVSVPLDRAADLLANDWKAVNDSKKLSPAKRDALAAVIKTTQKIRKLLSGKKASPVKETSTFNIE